MEITNIIDSINGSKVRVTKHAETEAELDGISLKEIFDSISNTGTEIIKKYLDDKPYPSCLVYSNGENNQPFHRVWGIDEQKAVSVLITVYKPNPDLWVDFRQRKKQF